MQIEYLLAYSPTNERVGQETAIDDNGGVKKPYWQTNIDV